MWDPYSGAYAYPRTQPTARYYRPRAPVYEQRGASRVQPENHFKSKVEEPLSKKSVRTIPVTDGSVPVAVAEPEVSKPAVSQKVPMAPVVKFESEDAAATKIQAVYRGHSVRKVEPLKHLKVIMKVKEEFQCFKSKFEEKEQRRRLCSDSQERLRWTEGIMALLLRLDQLQGVHPDVRLIRKALTKELIAFQEKLDSLLVSGEEIVEADAVTEEKSEVCDAEQEGAEVADGDMDIPAAEAVEKMEVEEKMSNVEDADLEETTRSDADGNIDTDGQQEAVEGTMDAKTDGPIAADGRQEVMEEVTHDTDGQQEAVEGTMEAETDGLIAADGQQEAMEEVTQDEADGTAATDRHEEGMEETTQHEADVTIASDGHQEAMEQDVAPAEESNECEQSSDGIKATEVPISEQHVPHDKSEGAVASAVTICQDQRESMAKDVEQDGSELGFTQDAAEVPMDVEETLTMAPARNLEEAEVKADGQQAVSTMDLEGDNQEPSGADHPVVAAPSTDGTGEPMSKEAASEKNDLVENHNQSHDVEVGDETERVADEAERPELDTSRNNGDDIFTCVNMEERTTDAGTVDPSDGWMIPAGHTSQCCAKGSQVGLPQVLTAGDNNSLSDRALLQQLLEENRKLKDVVGKVLHWGKQQNDIIHNLASRIEQLEEHQPQPNILHGEKLNGRKRISNDMGLAGDRERSLRSKGRRRGRQGNKPQLGYLDSEWLSAESDEYF